MKKYFKYILLLAVFSIAFGFYMYHKPHKNMESAKVEKTLSAAELFQKYETNETAGDQAFLDKTLAINGKVRNVEKNEDGLVSVTLETESDMFGVICQLDNLSQHKRTDFKEGEIVQFKGICTGVLMDVILVRCIEI